jgi:ATP-dependent DNA helicase RecG
MDKSSRNPVVADLFHRMKYMERRGSGLKKIGLFSTVSSFTVVLKNVNYTSDQVSDQDTDQVSDQDTAAQILAFCGSEKSKKEICGHMGYANLTYFTRKYLAPLIASGELRLTIPDKPNSKNQKYVRV